ncbi:MAG TPA: hypothetical protein VL096_09040 [Pirellulaceae bacterium]|nr:hypothetical protein [Pirellulaceae bacterium]
MRSLLLSMLAIWVVTGVAQGEDLQPLKLFAVTGSAAGNEVDYLAERKDKTTIYLFLNGAVWDRPIARYVKVLDTKLADGIEKAKDAHVVAVWLSDDAAKGKEYLPKAQQSLNLSKTDWTVFSGSADGPTGWNIDKANHLTVVLVRGNKETARFQYKSTNDTDVPELLKALEK